MVKCLCVFLCAVMLTGLLAGCSAHLPLLGGVSSYNIDKVSVEVVDANSRFAFDIFRQLSREDGDGNIFISPLSISTALAMTYQGARSTTREAMAKALRYEGIDDAKLNESYKNLIPYLEKLDKKVELNISNSLWVREGEPVKEEFLKVNKEVFNARSTALDFSKPGAADEINRWISNATKKKIEKMIEPPIPRDVIMYLINAIYFKGSWTNRFEEKDTYPAQFHAGDGSTVEVMMMSRNGKTEYGQGDGFKAVRLPYGSGKVAMYCILPDESVSINDFIEDLDMEMWKTIKESISEVDEVQLRLPRFKMEYGIRELKDSLEALGMGEAFSMAADFSGIRENTCISSVLHKAVIEVNEEGSEAAAATVVEVRLTAFAEPHTFIADRPFVFIIADDITGSILFMGKVHNIQ